MKTMLKRLAGLKNLFRKKRTPPFPEKFRMMMEMTADDGMEEIGCDEVYLLLDQYAEMMSRDEDPGVMLPLVKRHLEMCADCREELEALLRALEA